MAKLSQRELQLVHEVRQAGLRTDAALRMIVHSGGVDINRVPAAQELIGRYGWRIQLELPL